MTPDMLTAALLRPEEVPIGRAPTPDDAHADDDTGSPRPSRQFDATSFWIALVRRFRGEPPPTKTPH